ncbi:MAG: metallophosphoesterase [bacterium]|nr:metallophosphoesterase [bacterium]
MGKIWFTSDTHFGYAGIIGEYGRPYRSVGEMDTTLVANWNAVVRPDDAVWHLGDFWHEGERSPADYLARLNGRKHLVVGNHDGEIAEAPGWDSVQSYKEMVVEGQRLILFHYGLRVWHGSRRGSWMLFGHSHGGLPGNSQSLDVGVDCWDYRPVDLAQIRARLATLPPYVKC